MTVLVVGASGYLGDEVARLASAAGQDVAGTRSTTLDITSRPDVLELATAVRPNVIVNTASRGDSWAICADGAANVALAAEAVGARLIHLSSDALHAGRSTPYLDAETPAPVYAYGAAKAAAETAVAAIAPGAVIIRTSLIIGNARSKHLILALDLATGRRRGAMFTDEIRCPVAVQDLAAAVLELAASDFAGLLNVAGPEAMSRADLGRAAVAGHGLDPASLPVAESASAGLGARPADVRLDSSLATSMLRTRLRPASETFAATR